MNDERSIVDQESHNLILKGLSPLFIGSGAKYSQLDYVHHNNRIHILDFDKLLTQIPPEAIDELTNDINSNFDNNIWRGDIKEFLSKYTAEWEKLVEKKYELIGKIGKNEINQFIKTGNQIYIPGSSVKGAIRTAILFKILTDHPNRKRASIPNVLERFNDREIMGLIRNDGTTDLLRALIISDSQINENSNIKIVASTVYHLKNKESTIPIYYEILDKNFSGLGSVKINRKLVESNTLISKNFDLTREKILEAINSFSKEIINYELTKFKDRKDSNLEGIVNFYENLRRELGNLEDDECIMRLGQGSSILGLTMFLQYKENKQIIRKYKNLEIFHFNISDKFNRGYGIARKGRFTILPDRDSQNRPKLNEKWVCSIVATRGKNRYVNLLERITDSFGSGSVAESTYLYPLTRKFVVSVNNKLLSPFGWIKIKWE